MMRPRAFSATDSSRKPSQPGHYRMLVEIYRRAWRQQSCQHDRLGGTAGGNGEHEPGGSVERPVDSQQPEQSELHLRGLAIAPGLAIGRAFVHHDVLQRENIPVTLSEAQVEGELERIQGAIHQVTGDLEAMSARIERELKHELAQIFRAQSRVLHDPTLREEIQRELWQKRIPAEHVVREVFWRWENLFVSQEDEKLSQIRDDLRDLTRRLLHKLGGVRVSELEAIPPGSIIVAHRLLPSDTVSLPRDATAGVVVEFGGAGSHAALLTREMGIPAVARLPDVLSRVRTGQEIVVDGDVGEVIINPTAERKQEYRQRMRQRRRSTRDRLRTIRRWRQEGRPHLKVLANVGCREDVRQAVRHEAEGVGLYRLEHFYVSRDMPPTHGELVGELGAGLRLLEGMPCTIRLLDAGGDKDVPYLDMHREPDAFLGLRGVRLLLEYRDLARTQMRVLLELSRRHPIQILVPMITMAREMEIMRSMLYKEASAMGIEPVPPLGAMIETPAAALCADQIEPFCDFMSLGTNDLTQYTMVAGRENPLVTEYFVDSHPAIWKLIEMVTSAVHVPVTICGELAARRECLARMMACGIEGLSVAPPVIPEVLEQVGVLIDNRCEP